MSATFKFDPELWFRNKDLRACSPAARGFWVDVLCLCHPAGYLHVNGKPVDDTQLARMVGEPVKSVRAWLAELGEAGIYSVDHLGLHSSKMVKEAAFVGQAKQAGARGAVLKKMKRHVVGEPKTVIVRPDTPVRVSTAQVVDENTVKVRVSFSENGAVPLAKKAKPLPWYKSPAGWARKGGEQGVSLIPDEDIEDFKARVAARMPPGPHLEALAPYHRKALEAKFDQYALKDGEKSWAELSGVRR